MAEQDRETYKYLQIDRPILAGGDRFLASVEEIGRRAIGSAFTAGLTETHLDISDESLELVTTSRPIEQPRLDVYSPHDLKTVLLRRVASNKMGARYNFNHQAASLTARRKSGTARSKGLPTVRPGKSAQDLLDDISTQEGLQAGNTRIKCDRITEGYDPILGSFVALIPKSGPERFVLTKQARMAFSLLEGLSPRIAHGANPTIPVVPFASLPPDVGMKQHERLMDAINGSDLLPVSLVMGGIDIYTNSTVPRQNSLGYEEE
jgi:hypothetical protein